MSASGAPGPGGSPLPDKKLDSWKEIAEYLGREVRTVQRWEKIESLPVHRHGHQKRATVYAYAGELDDWFKRRQPKDDPEADAAFVPEPEPADNDDDAGAAAPSAAETPSSGLQARTPAQTIAPPAPRPRKLLPSILIYAAILGALALGVYRAWLRFRTPVPDEIRLVVLPFANLSGDPKQDYLSAGLTDVITTQLGRLDPKRLRVIAPTSAKTVSGKPIAEIRKGLNVQYILEGSVQPVASQVRIDVRLIQASDEAAAGTESFTRNLSDFLQVESDVAESVARRIEATLPSAGSTAAAPAPKRSAIVTVEAASKSSDAFLKGEIIWVNRGDLRGSISFFQEAITQDPYNALAHAGLANATAIIGQVPNDGISPAEAKSKATAAARRALELDPRLAEAHAILGNVAMSYDWDLPGAEKELKTALDLNPNYFPAYEWYAHLLMVQGKFDEALAENQHVYELEPATPLYHTVRAEILYHARRFDEAIQEAQSVLQASPDFALAEYWLGCSYREKKMYPQAVATFARAEKLTGDAPFMVMAYAHAQALAGNIAEARKGLRTLAQMKQTRRVPDIYPAAIHIALGEKDQAFQWLDSAYQDKVDRLVYLKVEPMADPLRSDPRFAQLLRKIGP
jgi:TolB-like protein/tetratricopeptide (TPR) repeat protein